MLNERQQLALACLRAASAGEWADADGVARRMRDAGDADASAQGVGRILSALAEAGHCDRSPAGGSWRYRVELRAVIVYDGDGLEAGRLLLWRTRDGLELDLGQLRDLLAVQDFRIELHDRDIRTVRAACDDALDKLLWRRR